MAGASGAAWKGEAGGACALAAIGLLTSACFQDRGPGELCVGAACVAGTTSSTSSSSGEPPPTSTGTPDLPGTPVDPAITLRISSMAFIDPHLFLSEASGGTDTTGGEMPSCVNDVTDVLNGVLNDDIQDGKFSLLARFEDFTEVHEMRLIDGDCEEPDAPGGLRVCAPNNATPAIILLTEVVREPGCRLLDPTVYAKVNLEKINDPAPPCLRTQRASFSLAVSDTVGTLDLRNAQMVATLDSAEAPTMLSGGVLYGFLPKVAAELIEIEAPLFGFVNLWSVIEASPCAAQYPELLPSVDMFVINDKPEPGAWVAINFTAEQVEYRSQ